MKGATMSFEDMFADVTFPDAKISVAGDVAVGTGQSGDSPPSNPGQAGIVPSPPAIEGAKPGDTPPPPPKGEEAKPGDSPTPPPYDQDPKWKAARAAEKALNTVLQEHGLLDVEELTEALKSGMTLKQLVGSRDAAKLIADSDELAKLSAKSEHDRRATQFANETPDETIARLTTERDTAISDRDNVKTSVEERQQSERVIREYNADVEKVIGSLETPVSESEGKLLRLMLGVDNPANMISIEDRKAVREMAQAGITNFKGLVQAVKQQAIDEYAAGKSKLVVSTRSQEGAPPTPSVERKPTPSNATPDQVFESGKAELVEILAKGMAAAM